jgi:hypothetical protein
VVSVGLWIAGSSPVAFPPAGALCDCACGVVAGALSVLGPLGLIGADLRGALWVVFGCAGVRGATFAFAGGLATCFSGTRFEAGRWL